MLCTHGLCSRASIGPNGLLGSRRQPCWQTRTAIVKRCVAVSVPAPHAPSKTQGMLPNAAHTQLCDAGENGLRQRHRLRTTGGRRNRGSTGLISKTTAGKGKPSRGRSVEFGRTGGAGARTGTHRRVHALLRGRRDKRKLARQVGAFAGRAGRRLGRTDQRFELMTAGIALIRVYRHGISRRVNGVR